MDKHKQDIWMETYKRDEIRGLRGLDIMTVISEADNGKRSLVARLDISPFDDEASPIEARVSINMTPAQMRALGASLMAHAARIDNVLLPLLQTEPTIVPIAIPTPLYHEPEAA